MTKRTARDELRKIDDAIEGSVLGASVDELREELAEEGLDWEKVVAETDALISDCKSQTGKLRLARAKEELKAFRTERAASGADRNALRARLNRMRAGSEWGMTMAARKGKRLSERDEEGALDDLELLRRLEAEDGETSEE
jgi:hypothetical protein